jgi:hypothetical protein
MPTFEELGRTVTLNEQVEGRSWRPVIVVNIASPHLLPPMAVPGVCVA